MAEEWISLREFARRREVRLSAVQKAIAAARVTSVKRDARGRLTAIDYIAGSEQWTANTDPTQAERSGTVSVAPSVISQAESLQPGELDLGLPAEPPDGEKTGVAHAASPTDGKDPHGYLEHRAKTERFKSAQAELNYLKDLGLVVSRADEATVKARRYRGMRDKLLGIADREAAVLAAERDSTQVHAILTKAIKQVLHELSDDALAEAARGVAERMVA
jgi:hypothetical protein